MKHVYICPSNLLAGKSQAQPVIAQAPSGLTHWGMEEDKSSPTMGLVGVLRAGWKGVLHWALWVIIWDNA